MRAITHNSFFASTAIGTKTRKAEAGRLWLSLALVLALVMVLPLQAQAQSNYVYVNNQAAANTVSAYSVSSSGSLTQLSGSPFSTGGVGANVVCYGLNRIALSPDRKSTRLNSSHTVISYAVFCLKKKKKGSFKM